MKKLFAPVLALLVCLFVASAFGADLPTTTSSSTASAVEGEQGRQLMDVGANFSGAEITVVPILAPALGLDATAHYHIASEALGGSLESNQAYQLANGKIRWRDLVIPGNPWVLQQVIIVRSKDGQDSISLLDIVVKARSNQGALDGELSLLGFGYNQATVGVKADGSRITSGPGNVKVAVIVFTAQMPLFIGGETQAGLDAVRTWVEAEVNRGSNGDFAIEYEVTLVGDTNSIGRARVSIRGPVGPTLTFDRFGRNHIYVTGAQPRATYVVEISENVTGPWRPVMSVITDDRGETWLGLSEKSQSRQFFRLRAD